MTAAWFVVSKILVKCLGQREPKVFPESITILSVTVVGTDVIQFAVVRGPERMKDPSRIV